MVFILLLRAVNVGGTGKLPMSDLKRLCEQVGLTHVKTYIASGNVVCHSSLEAQEVKQRIEQTLSAYSGKPAQVMVRTLQEMRAVLDANPFPQAPGNRSVLIFLDQPAPADSIEKATGRRGEEIVLGQREIYVFYGDGMSQSKLQIPAAKTGTARNMNTVAKLVEMSSELAQALSSLSSA